MLSGFLERIRARREHKRRKYLENESLRRQAQQERYRLEDEQAEQQQRVGSNPPNWPGGWIS